jgi:hypothetical protein
MGIGTALLQTVLGGLITRKLYQSDQKQSNSPTPVNEENQLDPINVNAPDEGVRLQTTADVSNKIPVVYGEAFTGGKMVDVEMGADNRTMYYCMVFSEKTGTAIDGTPSTFTFKDVYINGMRAVFKNNGVTIDYTTDRNSFQDASMRDLMDIYCYAGSSTNHVPVENVTLSPSGLAAYNIMPSWTSTENMSDLIFLIAKLKYAPGKNQTELPNITVHLQNSLTQPGDVLYDYMTNTRYGAGIALSEIYVA